MHGNTNMSNSAVPLFLAKLWKLVEDPDCNDLICWSPSGKSFHVFDQARFSKEILPKYFKHNNMASFVRQLNMYGFRKVVHTDHGTLKIEKDDMEFQHKYFVQDQEYLLEHIKRKATLLKSEDFKIKAEDVGKVLNDVKQLQVKQENCDEHNANTKKENEALWREIAILRQKSDKQQKIVNKLIQFLLSLVQPRGTLPVKRKYPLMLSDTSHSSTESKTRRLSRQLSLEPKQDKDISLPSVNKKSISAFLEDFVKDLSEASSQNDNFEHSGPIIHDITESSHPLSPDSDAFIPEVNLTECPDLSAMNEDSPGDNPLLELGFSLPASSSLTTNELEASSSSSSPDLSIALNDPKALAKSEINDTSEGMQSDIEMLKDLFSGSNYHFDPSLLLGIINLDGGLPSLFDLPEENDNKNTNSEIMGHELIQYNPPEELSSLLDMPNDDTALFSELHDDSIPEQSVLPLADDCNDDQESATITQ